MNSKKQMIRIENNARGFSKVGMTAKELSERLIEFHLRTGKAAKVFKPKGSN